MDTQGDFIYFIYRGICKILYPTEKIPNINQINKYIVLGHLKSGDSFGEQSALNDIATPFSIVACSPKLEYYKIHRSHFSKYFGGSDGE